MVAKTVDDELQPNRDIDDFLYAMFKHARVGTYAAVRVFAESGDDRGTLMQREVEITQNLDTLFNTAVRAANVAANKEGVFCLPIATFASPTSTTEANLAQGLSLTIDIDKGNTAAALDKLTKVIGLPTVVVKSGGQWQSETGATFPKVHGHWRLVEPTSTPNQHAQLKLARRYARMLTGGDATSDSVVHPIRCPGSWNLKDRPTLARIVQDDPEAEIDLTATLAALQGCIEAEGVTEAKLCTGTAVVGNEATAPIELIREAVAAIPNEDEEWHNWNSTMGLAIFAATQGSEAGYEIWRAWSAKSQKHDEATCQERWDHFHRSPPNRCGAGTLFYWARQAGWKFPKWAKRAKRTGKLPANEDRARVAGAS